MLRDGDCMNTYFINEVFCSLQGEGIRAGTANVFVRFTGCNLRCDVQAGEKSPGGFACDTEFASGRKVSSQGLIEWIEHEAPGWHDRGKWLILTGGEPGLQVDAELCCELHAAGYLLAIESNGTVDLSGIGLDWITISPKVAEHAVKQLEANEVKYVRGWGQTIPKTSVRAANQLISPAFDGQVLRKDVLEWCIKLVKENPEWRLSLQAHKSWMVR